MADSVQKGETLGLQLISLKGLGQSAPASAVSLTSSSESILESIHSASLSKHAVQM